MYINELGLNIKVNSEYGHENEYCQREILDVIKTGKIRKLIDILKQQPDLFTWYCYLNNNYANIPLNNLELTSEYINTLKTLIEKNPEYGLPSFHDLDFDDMHECIGNCLSKRNIDTFGADVMLKVQGGINKYVYDCITSDSKLMDILREDSERTTELIDAINEYNEHYFDERDISVPTYYGFQNISSEEMRRIVTADILKETEYQSSDEILKIRLKQVLRMELTNEELDKLEWRKKQHFGNISTIDKALDTEKVEVTIEDIKSKNIRVFLVPKYMSKSELEKQFIKPDATVEAEYGNEVIEGNRITLAHHTERYSKNPAPCNTHVDPLPKNSTIVVSHLDLDSIGGIASLMGIKTENKEFWDLAEFIDLNGLHRLGEYKGQNAKGAKISYLLYNAYQSNNKLPKITEITDITDTVLQHIEMVDRSIIKDEQLVEQAREWKQERNKKISDSLIYENEYFRIFYAKNGEFCSDSYYSKKYNRIVPCTIVMNGKDKSITLALEDGGKSLQEQQLIKNKPTNKFENFFRKLFNQKQDIEPSSAKDIVQHLWGNEAGGHIGIAGSPRGQEMTLENFNDICMLMFNLYNEKNNSYSKSDAQTVKKDINKAIKTCTMTKPNFFDTIRYKVQQPPQYERYGDSSLNVLDKKVEKKPIEDWDLE